MSNINKKITEIAKLLKNYTPDHNIGLLSGSSGIAIFCLHYSTIKNDKKIHAVGQLCLEDIIEKISTSYNLHTYCAGIAGFGWTIEYLAAANLIEIDTNELLNDLDDYLGAYMQQDIRTNHYDYLHGAVGVGLYFIKRWQNNPEKANLYLQELLLYLENTAHKSSNGCKWLCTLDHKKGTTGYNISLSHGSSAIAAFLAKLYTLGIEQERVKMLLISAMNYILAQQIDYEKYGSYFPAYSIESSGDNLAGSRLGWCYGDLGIGIVLWNVGATLDNKEWQEQAVNILLSCTQRTLPEQHQITDAGLCHGAAGVAHIFNRMHRNTKIAPFKEAAEYWFQQTLAMATHTDGLAGYKAYRSLEYGGWHNDYALLEGIAGICLSMFCYTNNIDPIWDECLLLS
jgi:lantibiotic biosynthesis protein